jgi:hypothetical protein
MGIRLVLLADDERPARIVKEQLADVGFDQQALLLDADNEIEAPGELHHDVVIERPDHADLQEPQPDIRRDDLVDT